MSLADLATGIKLPAAVSPYRTVKADIVHRHVNLSKAPLIRNLHSSYQLFDNFGVPTHAIGVRG
jgi:hypothetical protein